MKKYPWFIILLFFCASEFSNAQDDEPRLVVSGYLKDLVTLNIRNPILYPDSIFSNRDVLVDNIIHNRLNFKWYPNDNLVGVVEIRTQAFYGNVVNSLQRSSRTYGNRIPSYGSLIDTNNDWMDLSVLLINNDRLVLHSMIDRAYLRWTLDKLEVTLGRQRINWGTNLVWNPNDLFNAFNFFDFDYEERPGADALRVKYYTGVASSVEVAVKAADSREDFVAAGMWTVNKWGYDFQLLGGYAREDLTFGMGWAGNIADAGFKGEISWFNPIDDGDTTDLNDNEFNWLASMTWDYSFKNSLNLMGSFLYNYDGTRNPVLGEYSPFSTERLTPRDLSPYKVSAIFQASYQFHPLVTGSFSGMIFPQDRAFFVFPTLGISLKENLDLGFFAQFFWDDPFGNFQPLARTIFTRLKWSF